MPIRRRTLFARIALLLAIASFVNGAAMASIFGTLFAGSRPTNIGVKDGKLAPCPDRPNCVSSQAADADHKIAPIAFKSEPAAAMKTMLEVIRAMPRSTVVTATPDYVYVEFATPTMGFVDDTEFSLDAAAGVFNVRSAARLGIRDFGVNRDRVEAIRAAFAAKGA